MISKPTIPKGTRDFSPEEMLRREYIFDTIRSIFRLYGYRPIETPAMENLSTLLGKYGEEGDKLLFRILNSGDFLSGISGEEIKNPEYQRLSARICEKGLRYDLTVPFARYVVQHQNEISFPFKRYQIQPVWRADRPQKGRYREFFQCDADVIGSDSLLNEAELVRIISDVFSKLSIKVIIKLNNRKILAGIAEVSGIPERITDITVAIDKIDKIGREAVIEELNSKGISQKAVSLLLPVLDLKGSAWEKLEKLKELLSMSETGLRGVEEMSKLFGYIGNAGEGCEYEFDLTLARGLNYYTGAIIEVKSADVQIGSICGGGRYDNLTGIFGLPGVSGVGVSFGADRIYDVMLQLNGFAGSDSDNLSVLIINFGEAETPYGLNLMAALHKLGINAEMYPDNAKLKKQMAYADARKIPFVVIAGGDEIEQGVLIIKNMKSGEQKKISLSELSDYFETIA
jgi:histidyl-tRNA synthetase